MIEKGLFLISGIFVGYFIHASLAPDISSETQEATQKPDQLKIEPIATAPTPPSPKKEEATPSPHPSKLRLISKVIQMVPQTGSKLNVDDQGHLVKIHLTESLVIQMEEQLHRLADSARTQKTLDGWKIFLGKEDKLFTRAGLKNEDHISYNDIQSKLDHDEDGQLASRFIDILNSIRK